MALKPVQMLLKRQLSSCLMQGKTSITESGITVSTDRVLDEIILFFRTDSDEGRSCLDAMGSRFCDCLVFYTKESEQEEMLCFLELKANGLKDAKVQIDKTHQKVKMLLVTKKLQATYMACICMRRQAPLGDMRHVEELKRTFGRDNVRIKQGIKDDTRLGDFFRKRTT
ncbi:MAG: hypothetical protein NVS4B12_22870 [Ktedonobacteraceae bacterium]